MLKEAGFLSVLILAASAAAQMPTVVVGEAETADGNADMVVVEQPEGAPNPLGNPITVPAEQENAVAPAAEDNAESPTDKPKQTETLPMNSESGSDFQNTLLEANGRVYDVQSYPTKDLPEISNPANPKTIYSPNVNP